MDAHLTFRVYDARPSAVRPRTAWPPSARHGPRVQGGRRAETPVPVARMISLGARTRLALGAVPGCRIRRRAPAPNRLAVRSSRAVSPDPGTSSTSYDPKAVGLIGKTRRAIWNGRRRWGHNGWCGLPDDHRDADISRTAFSLYPQQQSTSITVHGDRAGSTTRSWDTDDPCHAPRAVVDQSPTPGIRCRRALMCIPRPRWT